MQIFNINTRTPKYEKLRSTKVTQPSFKSSDIPPENELIIAIRQNKLDPSVVNKKTGKTLFYMLVENNYTTAINMICAKPQLCSNVINIPYEGQTVLDIAHDSRMENLLIARNAKHFKDLTAEERGKYGGNGGILEGIKSEENSNTSQKTEPVKSNHLSVPNKQNNKTKTTAPKSQKREIEIIDEDKKEDARVLASKLNIGTVDMTQKYVSINDTQD